MNQNTFHFFKKTGMLMVFLLLGHFIHAQTISYPKSAKPLTRGLGADTLWVRAQFSTSCGANPTITINLGATNTPGVVQYVAGSLLRTGGTTGVNISQGNITNLSSPVFNVSGATGGSSIEFAIVRRINCGSAASSKDEVIIGNGCAVVENDPSTNSYNILAPSLTLTAPAQVNNANLGVPINRTFSVSNGGNGCLDTMFLWIKYPAGGATLNSLSLGGNTLTPDFTNGDSVLFKIFGSALGVDNKLCNGGNLEFTENVTLNACNISTSYGSAWNGFDNNICQSDVKTASVTMSNNLPTLVSSLINTDGYNFCFRADIKTLTYRITNNGAGAATNIRFFVSNNIPGSTTAPMRIDTTGGFIVKNSSGTVIQTINNFGAITTSSVYTASLTTGNDVNCGTPSYLVSVNATAPDLIIPAGSYVDIEVKMQALNLSCNNSCIASDIYSWLANSGNVTYQNQCKTATYVEAAKTYLSRANFMYRASVEHPTDINGYGTNNTFNYKISASGLQTFSNPNGTGEMYLAIDIKNTGIVPTVTTIPYLSYTFNVVNQMDTLVLIGPLPNNVSIGGGFLNVPMQATCGTSGAKTLRTYAVGKYSPCAPTIKFGCKSSTIFVHCPGVCPKGGATPIGFTLKRTTIGLADANNDGLPDGTAQANPNVIEDHHTVNGDTLQGTWTIKVFPNTDPLDANVGQNFNYVYIDTRLTDGAALGTAGSLSLAGAGTATIFPAGGGTPIVCTVNANITNGIYAHFELGPSCRQGVWQANDSIVFKANFKVIQTIGNVSSTGFTQFTTSNQVYSTYAQQTNNLTAPIANTAYTCDSYNDYSQISKIWWSPYIIPSQAINGCVGTIRADIRQYTRYQEGSNTFPYEYRNFYTPNIMKVLVPPGSVFRLGSASILDAPSSGRAGTGTHPIANANVSQVGDTVFIDVKNSFTTYGGNLIPPDEHFQYSVSFNVDPTCATSTGNYVSATNTTGIGNVINTAAALNFVNVSMPLLNGYYQPANTGYIYQNAQPNLSGGSTFNSSDGTATWYVVLQNQSNVASADNSWFYFSPQNGFTNIVVKEGTTTINQDANGFYRLGNLATSANRTFTITAKVNSCGEDSMLINSGYGCLSYPNSFILQSCTKSQWLKIVNLQSQIQLTVSQQPASPTTLCALNTVDFTINSAQAAYADNPQFVVTPPTGVTIETQQIEWPLGSGNWQTVTPTSVSGQLIYNIENHPALIAAHGTKGLPGTVDNFGTAGRQAKLRLTFKTSCTFVSGSKFTVGQRAMRPCGVNISNQLGYDNIVRTNSIDVVGVNNSGSVEVTSNIGINPVSCNNTLVSGTLMPLGDPFSGSDTMVVILQQGVNFDGAFTGAAGMTVVSGYPQVGPGGTQVLKVKIPQGTASGTGNQLNYSYNVKPTAASGCGGFSILTEIERTGAILSCNGNPCASGAKRIVGTKDTVLTIQKGTVTISNISLASGSAAHNSGPNTYNITIVNNGTNAIATNTLSLDFYCGASTMAFDTKLFPASIAPGATATASVTASSANVPACSTGSLVKVVANPTTGSNCLCSPSQITLSTPLPLDNLEFGAESNNKNVFVNWKVEGERNVKQYNVEHGTDGLYFNKIGYLPATGKSNYSFEHLTPSNGANFYRLAIEDLDGSTAQSNIVKVMVNDNNSIKIYPNPANHNVTIELANEPKNGILDILDVYGRTVMTNKLTKVGKNTFDLKHVVPGTYFVKVSIDGKSEIFKLTVVK